MDKIARLSAALVVGLAVTVVGQPTEPGILRPDETPLPQAPCATSSPWEMNGIHPAALRGGLGDGEPFLFEQDPPLLFADYTGPLTLHNFSVVGDLASVQFVRFTSDSPDGRAESWQRTATRSSAGGQLISVFEPTWNNSDVDATLSQRRVGFDRPFTYWGGLQVPGSTNLRSIYLRVGFRGIPSSPVIRINDSVQYASNVVNLVVPTFDEQRVARGQTGFDEVAATQLFYRYFGDVYDVISFTSEAVAVGDFGAYHYNVRNAVSGINLNTFDFSRAYGSNSVLQGVEVYLGNFATLYEDTDHEMAHQWASNFDWTRIANIARAGHQSSAHSPLWTGGETLIGAVLFGDRRVGQTTATGYVIEETPPPAHYHPIEQYAMGLLTADQVPDFLLFTDQGQFAATTAATPAAGTAVSGTSQPASITDVVRVHGSRSGPAISSPWRRATVLVSKDHLASQQQMDFWNFYAQRLGDRNRASRPDLNNFVSFRRATGTAVELSTRIEPLTGSPLAETLEIDTPFFGTNDWRGISFTSPVPSRFVAGQTVTVTGRITASDAVDFTSIALGFWGLNATTPIRFFGTVNRARDFTVSIRFNETQRGSYYLSDYLYWADSGSQYPRSSLSPIVVE